MMERETATVALSEALRAANPEKGFKIHPHISFASKDGGRSLGAFATGPIEEDAILLVIPESARFTTDNLLRNDGNSLLRRVLPKFTTDYLLRSNDGCADGSNDGISLLRRVLPKMERKCDWAQKSLCTDLHYGSDPREFSLAVMVMWFAAASGVGVDAKTAAATDMLTIWSLQAATWPSEDEVRCTMPAFWDESEKDVVGKSYLRDYLEQRRELLRRIFDRAVFPVLSEECKKEGELDRFILPGARKRNLATATSAAAKKDALWDSFRYAFTIVYSRVHGQSAPVIVPLVEMFNGTDDDGNTNVDLVRGMWPFISGKMYKNECNIPCSAVHATRSIDEGEELIISYGNLSPSEFVVKYGTIPRDLLVRHNMADKVDVYCPPDLVPTDALRIEALHGSGGYPIEDLRSGKVALATLDSQALAVLRSGGEDEMLASVRQFLVLGKLVDDEAVELNIRTGRLRGQYLPMQIGVLLVRVFDYNLHLLDTDGNTSASDIEESDGSTGSDSSPEDPSRSAALLGRVCQRETLLMWRHLICKKYGLSDMILPSLPPPCLSGVDCCEVCGRTYPIRKCSRCRVVKYCSREHQKSGWRAHRVVCKQTS